MINRIVLVGRLVRDPELRFTANGKAVGTFTLAVDRPFTSRQVERDTDFINIVTWENSGDLRQLPKGQVAWRATAGSFL